MSHIGRNDGHEHDIDLAARAGLALSLTAEGRLRFGAGIPPVQPQVRRLAELRPVLLDREATGPDECYYMYRGVARSVDEPEIRRRGLRYDVTVLRPGQIGREPVKTAGHYHPVKPGQHIAYPEVYEVLHGQACYLLQRRDEQGAVRDVFIVCATAGDKVLMPPGYGHITVNAGGGWLVMANWVDAGFASIYEPIRAAGGGALFAVREPGGGTSSSHRALQWVPNRRCWEGPARVAPAVSLEPLGLPPGEPMYRAVLQRGDGGRWLTHPEEYRDILDSLTAAYRAAAEPL